IIKLFRGFSCIERLELDMDKGYLMTHLSTIKNAIKGVKVAELVFANEIYFYDQPRTDHYRSTVLDLIKTRSVTKLVLPASNSSDFGSPVLQRFISDATRFTAVDIVFKGRPETKEYWDSVMAILRGSTAIMTSITSEYVGDKYQANIPLDQRPFIVCYRYCISIE
ncbi:hypothetical protein PMAYCL1PPCAC_05499, partial [Pristionchus mayeri]